MALLFLNIILIAYVHVKVHRGVIRFSSVQDQCSVGKQMFVGGFNTVMAFFKIHYIRSIVHVQTWLGYSNN